MQESATCGIQQKISHIAPFCIQKPKCKCIVLVSTGVFFSQSQASCFLLPVFPLSQAGRLLSYQGEWFILTLGKNANNISKYCFKDANIFYSAAGPEQKQHFDINANYISQHMLNNRLCQVMQLLIPFSVYFFIDQKPKPLLNKGVLIFMMI